MKTLTFQKATTDMMLYNPTCGAHTLQLVIKNANLLSPLPVIMKKGKKIVKFFNKSSKTHAILKAKGGSTLFKM
jgi:hypothetical protein